MLFLAWRSRIVKNHGNLAFENSVINTLTMDESTKFAHCRTSARIVFGLPL